MTLSAGFSRDRNKFYALAMMTLEQWLQSRLFATLTSPVQSIGFCGQLPSLLLFLAHTIQWGTVPPFRPPQLRFPARKPDPVCFCSRVHLVLYGSVVVLRCSRVV